MRFNPLEHREIFLPAERLTFVNAWAGHIPFAFLLMELTRPKTLVELGTHTGVSYCAFCQGVKMLGLSTRCFAVDAWAGDAQSGPVLEAEYQDLRAHHDPRYGTFSTLVRCTFDQALTQFGNKSIDVLHIDGGHTYEMVKHDFEAWRPKLSDAAVVLFHNIAERRGDFGIWRLWSELSGQFASVSFGHGGGLGVLAIGSAVPRPLLDFIEEARQHPWEIAAIFASMGDVHKMRGSVHLMANMAYRGQLALNQWRRAAGLPVDANSENPKFVSEHPLDLAIYSCKCVQEMVGRSLAPRAVPQAAPGLKR